MTVLFVLSLSSGLMWRWLRPQRGSSDFGEQGVSMGTARQHKSSKGQMDVKPTKAETMFFDLMCVCVCVCVCVCTCCVYMYLFVSVCACADVFFI